MCRDHHTQTHCDSKPVDKREMKQFCIITSMGTFLSFTFTSIIHRSVPHEVPLHYDAWALGTYYGCIQINGLDSTNPRSVNLDDRSKFQILDTSLRITRGQKLVLIECSQLPTLKEKHKRKPVILHKQSSRILFTFLLVDFWNFIQQIF